MWNPYFRPGPNGCLLTAQVLYIACAFGVFLSRIHLADLLLAFGILGPLFFGAAVIALRLQGTRFHPIVLVWHFLFTVASCATVYYLVAMAAAV
jgi:hypothetical protein